jgi:hypothetical protein
MAITSLDVTVAGTQQWNASNTITGLSSPTVNSGRNSKQQNYVNTTANNALGGADQYFNFLLTISAGASATLDLTAMTNVLQQTSVSIARIKAYQFQLLDVADDATNGTACSSVTFGALGTAVTNGNTLNLGSGSGLTVNVTSVATSTIDGVSVVAGGTGYPKSATFAVVVVQGAATGGILAATTNSSGVVTGVAIINGGTGYSIATPLNTFVLANSRIFTGGCVSYFDQTTGGFTVSSSAKNVVFQNNDAVVAAALLIQITAGSS